MNSVDKIASESIFADGSNQSVKRRDVKFLVPPVEITPTDKAAKITSFVPQVDIGFEFLRIGQKEKKIAGDETRRLLLEISDTNHRSTGVVNTLHMPNTAFLVNAHSNEKASGKVGKLRIFKSGRVVANICGNDYEVVGNQLNSIEEIMSVISGLDCGKDFDEGVHIGTVQNSFRLIPKSRYTST